jgi:Fe-S-cluster containining protein
MLKKSEPETRSAGENSKKESPNFLCFRCGICCTGYQIYMTSDESYALAERLGISQLEFEYNYLDPHWPFPGTVVLRHNAGRCLFLDQPADSILGLCRIHSFKPFCCRQWQASLDHKECRQGLNRYWGLSVGENGELKGSPEDMLCFQAFTDFLSEEEEV